MPRAETETTNVDRLPRRGVGPIAWFLNFFSSIWLGVCLLIALFVYCTIGSIGVWLPGHFGFIAEHDWIHDIQWGIPWTQVHLRQAPGLEMTEFEWFHWWPFNLLIALICLNLIVATIRRIPLTVINLGVWMIHSGIIILAAGSVVYFSTKLEGDAPVVRRQVVISAPGFESFAIPALPGNQHEIETDAGTYRFRIFNIDPDWEILSGDDKGKRAYAVQVAVETPEREYLRQLLAGYPQYTEDTIWTGRREQPMVRAINEIGKPLVDETMEISLVYKPQEYFYLMNSAAIYLREKGSTAWVQRPIRDLPRYNDYINRATAVWPRFDDSGSDLPLRPIAIDIPPMHSDDPLGNQPIQLTGYLRYAFPQSRPIPGGDALNPVVDVRLASARNGQTQSSEYRLLANDPARNSVEGGRLRFIWADTEEAVEDIVNRPPPQLRARIEGLDTPFQLNARPMGEDGPFQQIGETEYAYRVQALQDGLTIQGQREPVSIAIVEIRSPDRTFRRWVFDDPNVPARDFAIDADDPMHEESLPLDPSIEMTYEPAPDRALLTLLAGPRDQDLRLVMRLGGDDPVVRRVIPGERLMLQPGTSLEIINYAARTELVTRPAIVPPQQREANDRQQRSMVRIEVPGSAGQAHWLTHHLYAFRNENETLRRFPYRPTEITLADGRVLEVMYSRQRRRLPAAVALEDFVLTTHIGGFTGSTLSIRDWTSVVKFEVDDAEQAWTNSARVSMNKPTSHEGFWFFQAQWDPPDPPRFEGDAPSNGLNFTVLGVGNRNGVYTQLAGCVIAVFGMIYAFYIKPILKRRRAQQVYAGVTAMNAVMRTQGGPASVSATALEREPVTSVTEKRS